MAVTRKTDLAGYRYQVSVGGFAARPCLIPRWGNPCGLPQRAPRGGGGGAVFPEHSAYTTKCLLKLITIHYSLITIHYSLITKKLLYLHFFLNLRLYRTLKGNDT